MRCADFFIDTPVHIAGDTADVTSNSATYDLKANKIVLTGNVKMAILCNFAPVQGLAKP
jgi:lipopolysaccharide export system protein LptA